MLELNYGFLCDAATISSDGKVNILGIFDNINAREFPAVHPHLVVVANWRGDAGDYKVNLRLVSPDGKEILKIPDMEANIKVPGGKANIVANLSGVKFETYGMYLFELEVVGQDKKFQIPLNVSQIQVQ